MRLTGGTSSRLGASWDGRGTNFALFSANAVKFFNGAWVPVFVGNQPVVDGDLGRFDAGAYAPGEYAFRLMVLDAAGNSPPPCVVAVTLASLTAP